MQNLHGLVRTSTMLAFVVMCFVECCGAEDSLWKLKFSDQETYRNQCVMARFSPNGALLAIGCQDNSIRLWDLSSGKEIRRLIGHTSGPTSISFSPDSKRIVSCAAGNYPDSAIRVWSVATGEQLYEHKTTQGKVRGLAVEYHPSGKAFAAELYRLKEGGGFQSNTVELFDAATFMPVRTVCQESNQYRRIQYSSNGDFMLLNGGAHNGVRFLNLPAGQVRRLDSYENILSMPELSSDGKYIAGTNEGEAIVLDSSSHTEVRRLKASRHTRSAPDIISLRFTPDCNSLAIVTKRYELIVFDLSTGVATSHFNLKEYEGSVHFSEDASAVVVIHDNHATLWDISHGRAVARLHCMQEDGQWACQVDGGFYHHSKKVVPSYDTNAKANVDEYRKNYMKAEVVARVLGGMAAGDAERLRNGSTPPVVGIQAVDVQQAYADFSVVSRATVDDAAVDAVEISKDGRVESTLKAGPQIDVDHQAETIGNRQLPQPSRGELTGEVTRIRVRFSPGRTTMKVRALAKDSKGQSACSEEVIVSRPKALPLKRGRFFVLAVGVSQYANSEYNLAYCHRDAEDIANRFLQQKGLAYADVQIQVLVDGEATVSNINEGLEWIKRSCTENDVALILFAGHGVKGERGLYYVPHDGNLDGIQYTCLNWETVAEALQKTKAAQVFFLADTCHAGAFAESNLFPQQELAKQLQASTRATIFSSSRNDEASVEDMEWEHGAFAKAFLDGLEGSADLNHDGLITIAELDKSVTESVVKLTNDTQHPVMTRPKGATVDVVVAGVVPK